MVGTCVSLAPFTNCEEGQVLSREFEFSDCPRSSLKKHEVRLDYRSVPRIISLLSAFAFQ